jgi:TFIIF-interacting CTD phosphatase-like protein
MEKNYHDKPLLILDLDETLIHTSDHIIDNLEHLMTIPIIGHTKHWVYTRPYFKEFTDYCYEHFDVAIWTAASPEYAHSILPQLFGEKYTKLAFIFTGERCTLTSDSRCCTVIKRKDLRKVTRRKFNGKKYNKHKMLMIDDKAYNFARNYGMGILIYEWNGNHFDIELKRLQLYLEKLLKTDGSWRFVEKRNWTSQININF